jgi:hypothetical protein
MAANREAIIQEFSDSAELDRRVMETVARILARNPRAVLIAWEDAESFGVTAVPFSNSLVKGMVDSAFDAVFDSDTAEEEDLNA